MAVITVTETVIALNRTRSALIESVCIEWRCVKSSSIKRPVLFL